ncbi:MAG: tol-pal system YbgF family protein [Geobacteraceae bacterium]
MGTAKKIVLHIILISVLFVILFWGNTLFRQHQQFSQGEQALARRDVIAAISGYASAIHMYTPGSDLVNTAANRLWSLGESLEQAGDTERALIAYRSLRSSFYAIRGLTNPGTGWIARCDRKLENLTTTSSLPTKSSKPNQQF